MDVKSGIPLVHREPRTRGGAAIRFSLYKYAQYADIRWATEVHVLQASPLVHLDGVPYVEVPATVTWGDGPEQPMAWFRPYPDRRISLMYCLAV